METTLKTTAALLIALGASLAAGCAVTRNHTTSTEYVDDAALAALVRSRLHDDPAMHTDALLVEAMRGTVLLSGYAKSQAEKERAGLVARAAPGVKAVRNDIVVYP